jgi:integrase
MRCRETLDTRDRRVAERREEAMRRALEDPAHWHALAAAERRKVSTVADFADRWREVYVAANTKPSTARGYEQVLRVHIVPALGALDLRTVDRERVEELKASLVSTGRSAKTCSNVLGVLQRMMRSAVEWDYLDRNPCDGVAAPHVPEPEIAWWTRAESALVLEACATRRPGWYPLFLFGLRTGLRLGELAALRWRDVQLDGDACRVHVCRSWSHGHETDPKGKRSRDVPMSPDLVEVMRAHQASARVQHRAARVLPIDGAGFEDRLVFPGRRGFMTHTEFRSRLNTCADQAGVRRLTPHGLRHSFASQLVAAGVHIREVQQLLGHADVRQTERYAHLAPGSSVAAVALLDGAEITMARSMTPR